MAMEPPELSSLKSLLNVSRVVALVLFILGIIWIAGYAVADAALGAGPIYTAGNLAYPVIFTVFELLVWVLLKGPIDLVNRGQFAAAREQTIFPMILGFIAVLIVGLLLLIAYTKFDSVIAWQRGAPSAMAPTWAPMAGPPVAAPPPPATTPPAAVPSSPAPAYMPGPPMAAVTAAATCPRCGRPATWIAQYSRWYCYTDQQYV